MELICNKWIGVVTDLGDQAIVLNSPIHRAEDEYHSLPHRYHICQTAYVPPEFRDMTIVNVTSKTEIKDSSIMYRYEDPSIPGNKIFGIALPMAA